jgi:uncharacterized protein DUF6508
MPSLPTEDLARRLDGIVAFLPLFGSPGFDFGHWVTSRPDEPDVLIFPYFMLSVTAEKFVKATYAFGWVVSDFDWQTWAETAEAVDLCENQSALGNASPEQLAKLLTWQIRVDRFVEGSLSKSFGSGMLTNILRRAQAIRVGET